MITTYPLDNILYNAAAAQTFHCTRTTGVFTGDFPLSVSGSDNQVTVGIGVGWVRLNKLAGVSVAMDSPTALSDGAADPSFPRIDAVVLKFSAQANKTTLEIKKGTPASRPKAPEVVRNGSVMELHLYHINRKAGKATVELSDIEDLRPSPEYCGLMLDELTALDPTLSKEGGVADAKATGDALAGKADKSTVDALKILSDTTGSTGYVKLPDGTLITRQRYSAVCNTYVAEGSIYRGNMGIPPEFPITFKEMPTVFITLSDAFGFWVGGLDGTPSTTSATGGRNLHIFSATSLSKTITANILAIGRWK